MTTVSKPGAPRPVTPSTILAQKLRHLVEQVDILGYIEGIEPRWRADLREAAELAVGLDPYLERWSSPESSALAKLTERTQAEDWGQHSGQGRPGPLEQEMLSGHVEGQVLKMLVHTSRAAHVLEIGMFTGYSALAMAEALPDEGRVVACEIDPDVADFAQMCFDDSPDGRKIDVRVGPAHDTLQDLAATDALFELVFIDADKAGYLDYVDAVLSAGLLAPHGLICVDNTLMQGQPWTTAESTANGTAIADFNEAVAADPRLEQVIIPLRDGLTLIRQVDR